MITNQIFQVNKSGAIDHDDPGAKEQVWVQLRNKRVVQTPLWNASLMEQNLEGFIVTEEEAKTQFTKQQEEGRKARESIDPQGFIERLKTEHPERGGDAETQKRFEDLEGKMDKILALLSSK